MDGPCATPIEGERSLYFDRVIRQVSDAILPDVRGERESSATCGGEMELRSWRTWLRPGMLIKRWVILAMVGIIVISLGLAMGLAWAYRSYYWQLESTSGVVRFLTLQFIPHPYRELVLIVPGIAMLGFGLWKLGHAVIGPI